MTFIWSSQALKPRFKDTSQAFEKPSHRQDDLEIKGLVLRTALFVSPAFVYASNQGLCFLPLYSGRHSGYLTTCFFVYSCRNSAYTDYSNDWCCLHVLHSFGKEDLNKDWYAGMHATISENIPPSFHIHIISSLQSCALYSDRAAASRFSKNYVTSRQRGCVTTARKLQNVYAIPAFLKLLYRDFSSSVKDCKGLNEGTRLHWHLKALQLRDGFSFRTDFYEESNNQFKLFISTGRPKGGRMDRCVPVCYYADRPNCRGSDWKYWSWWSQESLGDQSKPRTYQLFWVCTTYYVYHLQFIFDLRI